MKELQAWQYIYIYKHFFHLQHNTYYKYKCYLQGESLEKHVAAILVLFRKAFLEKTGTDYTVLNIVSEEITECFINMILYNYYTI